jgi:hypothetical protein
MAVVCFAVGAELLGHEVSRERVLHSQMSLIILLVSCKLL